MASSSSGFPSFLSDHCLRRSLSVLNTDNVPFNGDAIRSYAWAPEAERAPGQTQREGFPRLFQHLFALFKQFIYIYILFENKFACL